MTIKQYGGIFGRKPTFSKIDVNGPEASSFDRTGSLGEIVTFNDDGSEVGAIGTNGNIWFQGPSGTAGVEFANGAILPWRDGARASGAIAFGSSSYKFNGGHFSDNLVMDNGKGIDFSATSDAGGMTSELFDDYEEGTWTPVYTTGSGAFGTITYDVQSAFYVKVGNVCVATFRMRTDSVDAGTATSLFVGGLPFTSGSSPAGSGNVAFASTFAGDFPSTIDVNPSSTAASLRYRTSANGATLASDAADLGTGGNANFFAGTIVYITA